MKTKTRSCYSKSEIGFMDWFSEFKKNMFLPLLKLFKSAGISPNTITLVSLACGVLSGIFIFFRYLSAAVVFLILHLFLDGIDGTLAIYLKKRTFQGGIFDVTTDLIVLFFITAGLTAINLMNPLLSLWFIFVYVSIVVISVVRNQLKIPYKIVLRPRLLLYAFFLIYFIANVNLFNMLLWVCNIIMSISFVSGTYAMLKGLKNIRRPAHPFKVFKK